MKDSAFQYATSTKVYKDTGLITLEQCKKLWEEHLELFKEHIGRGEDPEMCIWTDMASEADYHAQNKYLHALECEVRDGVLYKLEPIS